MRKLLLPVTLSFFTMASMAYATASLKDQARETASDTKRGAQETVRKVKDETCELVNGKMECAAQKTKHSIQKASDKVEDAID
jgi:uncharacterized protein YjbJ (UPF0337 family)